MNGFFEFADLLISVINKMLPTKPWIDAHDQDLVNIAKDVPQQFDPRMWIDCHSGFHTERFYLLNISMQMTACFIMDDQTIRAGFFKIFGISFRLLNHEMNIKRLCSDLAQLRNNG